MRLRENWPNILAIGISLLTLIAVMYQANISREHNKLSVVPIVFISEESDRLEVINSGLGPAIVNGIEVLVDDQFYHYGGYQSFYQLIHQVIQSNDINISDSELELNLFEGYLLVKPEQPHTLIRLVNSRKKIEFQKLLEKLEFGTCYKSVYDDYFYNKTADFELPLTSCNYMGSIKIFGHPIRLKSPIDTPITLGRLIGKE